MNDDPYLDAVRRTLPRLLALFDTDSTGAGHGMGDRYYWAWGLIDFGNGTFQGAAHGLARLWCAGIWPYPTTWERFLTRVDALFHAAARLTRRDGSLEEAFPHEGSYCVTALVAFDLLCAADLLGGKVPDDTRRCWREIIRPMIEYLLVADETHALISNHLATAVAALARWRAMTGDARAETRARELLGRILRHQSSEGWFREYEGADPGYQSLCTYYLADVHRLRPDWELAEPLARSLRFLWCFAHPDGSFGGVYGSRCTRFYYPAGVEALAPEIPEAASLAEWMAESVRAERVVTLCAMDEPNLVPMFNAYCWAATLRASRPRLSSSRPLPSRRGEPSRLVFPEAGLWIDAGPRHYTVINTHKGGIASHFRDGCAVVTDDGVVVRNRRGLLASTQAFALENEVELDGDTLIVKAALCPMPKRLPTPAQFVVLRLMCLTVFRSRPIREWVKRALVRMLITRRRRWPVRAVRRIRLGPDLEIHDELEAGAGYTRVEVPGGFVAIHMASQGYWQIQDEDAR